MDFDDFNIFKGLLNLDCQGSTTREEERMKTPVLNLGIGSLKEGMERRVEELMDIVLSRSNVIGNCRRYGDK